MKLTQIQTAAAAVVGTLAVIGLGSAIRAASIHEQNCLSYERQSTEHVTTMLGLVEKSQSIMNVVNENPFAAFGLIGEMLPLQTEVENTSKAINDTKYAFVKTCGQPRFNQFVETPEFKTKVDALTEGAASLTNS